jgi:hypothetical protein
LRSDRFNNNALFCDRGYQGTALMHTVRRRTNSVTPPQSGAANAVWSL